MKLWYRRKTSARRSVAETPWRIQRRRTLDNVVRSRLTVYSVQSQHILRCFVMEGGNWYHFGGEGHQGQLGLVVAEAQGAVEEERSGEEKVTAGKVFPQADREWVYAVSWIWQVVITLSGEMARLNQSAIGLEPYIHAIQEGTIRPDSVAALDTYRRAVQECRRRAYGIFEEYRALTKPKDPRLVETDRLMENSLLDMVTAFDEICAFCDDFDEGHVRKACDLLDSFNEKGQRAMGALES